MDAPAKPKAVEYFAVPDDLGPIKASDLVAYDRFRVITDAHHFIVPLIFFLGCLLLWLSLRLAVGRKGGRLRRMIGLWFEAKERELAARAGKPLGTQTPTAENRDFK